MHIFGEINGFIILRTPLCEALEVPLGYEESRTRKYWILPCFRMTDTGHLLSTIRKWCKLSSPNLIHRKSSRKISRIEGCHSSGRLLFMLLCKLSAWLMIIVKLVFGGKNNKNTSFYNSESILDFSKWISPGLFRNCDLKLTLYCIHFNDSLKLVYSVKVQPRFRSFVARSTPR